MGGTRAVQGEIVPYSAKPKAPPPRHNGSMQINIPDSKIATALARSLPPATGINLNGIGKMMLSSVDKVINTYNNPVFDLQASNKAWANHGSVLQS
ncbi:MAG: hypothetical protein O3C63_02800 [Cyanobacteria bacterium]|nr:hypothetical protein [Cyanobacteriota bacterium]